jgi:hypothetical protein
MSMNLPISSREEQGRRTLAARLFGIVWERAELGDVVVTPYEGRHALSFVAEHYPRIFGGAEHSGALLDETTNEAKRRFVDEMDVFSFRKDGNLIGISMTHPTDWSSYYFRTFALLEHARSAGLAGRFFHYLCPRLVRAGVHRIEAEVQPSNVHMMHVLANLGFVATGTLASERWGLLVRMTHHLTEAASKAFVTTYAPNRVHPNP